MGVRGQLTPAVKFTAQKLMGREITLTEFRLMPYVQYTMMNSQKIDPNKISEEERTILQLWRKEGRIQGGASGMAITKEFWDAINEILFMGYVDID
jgi:hypothetical protein